MVAIAHPLRATFSIFLFLFLHNVVIGDPQNKVNEIRRVFFRNSGLKFRGGRTPSLGEGLRFGKAPLSDFLDPPLDPSLTQIPYQKLISFKREKQRP